MARRTNKDATHGGSCLASGSEKKSLPDRKQHHSFSDPINNSDCGSSGGRRKSKRRTTSVSNNNKHVAKNHDYQLREAVEAGGSRTIVDMSADGNCLFRSLADQLYRDRGNQHAEVRSEICDFMHAHEKDFSVFLVFDEADEPDTEDAADFETYVNNMRQDGEWGGNLELVAAARLYRRNITVFSANLTVFTIEHGHTSKPPSGPDLWVSYHDNDHYNSVRDNNTHQPFPAPIKIEDENHVHNHCHQDRYTRACDDHYSDTDDADFALPAAVEQESIGNRTAATTSTTTSNDVATSENNSDPKKATKHRNAVVIKKNMPCPCGSGLRYKRCCLAAAKRKTHLKRVRGGGAGSTSDMDEDDDDKHGESIERAPTNNMDGAFRILKI